MPSFFLVSTRSPKRGLARSRLGLPGPRRLFSRNAVLGSISIAESYSQCQASGGRGKDSENSARRPAPRNASRVSRETRRMGVNGVRLGAAPADFLRARRAERIEHLRCAIERWRGGRTRFGELVVLAHRAEFGRLESTSKKPRMNYLTLIAVKSVTAGVSSTCSQRLPG